MQMQFDIKTSSGTMPGELFLPNDALGIVLFTHGSGSSRYSPRNRSVATTLNRSRLATLLFDLLTPGEESCRHHRQPNDCRRQAQQCRETNRAAQ